MSGGHSEFVYGSMLADKLFADLQQRQMEVGDGQKLIGGLCREGFVSRLAELLDVESEACKGGAR